MPTVDRPVIDEDTLDRLMDQIDAEGLELLGPEGVLIELTSQIMNRALDVELTDHLGYERGDPAGRGSGNNRNGTTAKKVLTDAGAVPVDVPRDRNGTFEPKLVAKHQRRLRGFNDLVVGLVARGMTVRDVQAHLADAYQVEVSPELISKITDAAIGEPRAWQARPLDAVYPVIYVDAIVVKVRTDRVVVNRPVYLALGVDVDGAKHVLGLWLGDGSEGAKFWLAVCTELNNRGVATCWSPAATAWPACPTRWRRCGRRPPCRPVQPRPSTTPAAVRGPDRPSRSRTWSAAWVRHAGSWSRRRRGHGLRWCGRDHRRGLRRGRSRRA